MKKFIHKNRRLSVHLNDVRIIYNDVPETGQEKTINDAHNLNTNSKMVTISVT